MGQAVEDVWKMLYTFIRIKSSFKLSISTVDGEGVTPIPATTKLNLDVGLGHLKHRFRNLPTVALDVLELF